MDLQQILEEFPVSLRALTENHENLLKVAEYCSDTYVQACGGAAALTETRSLLTQSLASVAFQINSVAESLLTLLDLQGEQLSRLQGSVQQLGQSVDMHREKVARREIGSFTAQRRVPRCHKLLPPAQAKPRPPYSRQPINFQRLDELGHGVKGGAKLSERGGSRKQGASFRTKPLEPVQCPTAPPVVGSFGKAVAPPSVPSSWQTPPPCDVIEPLTPSDITDEAPPPPEVANESRAEVAPPPPPPPPPPPANQSQAETPDPPPALEAPPPPHLETPPPLLETLPPLLETPPPLLETPPPLETVLEESSFPPPPDDFTEATPPSPDEAPPPPPPPPITDELGLYDLEIPPPPLIQDQD